MRVTNVILLFSSKESERSRQLASASTEASAQLSEAQARQKQMQRQIDELSQALEDSSSKVRRKHNTKAHFVLLQMRTLSADHAKVCAELATAQANCEQSMSELQRAREQLHEKTNALCDEHREKEQLAREVENAKQSADCYRLWYNEADKERIELRKAVNMLFKSDASTFPHTGGRYAKQFRSCDECAA